MFLKSLEIKGFKSFADKTELEFRKGVTAVVGPNGSGKSNISDAIRWVLGEQSVKTLRGSKMEDVIFSGTQYRKSVGLAQVSLTLDNSSKELPLEYSDVTITRRIFRSGESEYLINNSKCRLKDIVSLFMDTGIGKEGYSLIGQGKIDAILSGKAEERRGLLEEAAGIVKFKSRKEESEKRLKNTEENLTRINDIVSTYEERLEPLKLENEKAKEFLNLSENLKEKEVSILVHKIKQNNEVIKTQEEIILSIKNKNFDISKDVNNNKCFLRDKEQCLEKIEENYNEDKALYYKSKEDSKELSFDIEVLKERILNFKEGIVKSDNLISEYNDKLTALKDYKNTLISDLKNKINRQGILNTEINSYEDSIKEKILFSNKVEEDLKTLNYHKINSQKSVNKINNDLSLIDNEINNLKINIDILNKGNSNSENLIKINISTKNSVLEKLDKDNSQILNLKKDIDNKNNQINKYNNEILNLSKKISKLNSEFNKLEARKSVLINLEEQYEGYTKSVKNLMEHLNKSYITANNIKVLGDVISVGKNIEKAIEIALGNSISNIITDNEIDAKRLIEYLKVNRLGRATFLPLNIIKSKTLRLDDRIKKLNGFIGIASELINYDNKYIKAIESVLGRTIICSDMDTGLEIAKAINFSYKIVTLSGDVINPGGALTGGSSYNRSVGVISRKRDIEELIKSIDCKRNDLEKENKSINLNKQNLKIINEEVLELKDKIQILKVEVATSTNEVRNIDKDILRIKDSLKLNYKDIDLIKEKIEKLKLNSINYISQKANLEKIDSENNIKIINLENLIKDLTLKISNNKDVMNNKKILKAQLDELISNKNAEYKRIESESEELINKILNLSNSTKSYNENISLCTKKIDEDNKNINNLKATINILEEKFTNLEFQKEKLKDEIKKLNEIIENLLFENRKVQDEIHKNELINTKIQGQKDNYLQKLNEEYNLTLAEAKDLSFKIENEDVILKDISNLKYKINKLGTVNVSAIEEYKEVLDKYTFMSNQIEDLSKSKEELLKVISEMTVKMKELFKDNFKNLNIHFNETFRELFKGGSANLILCDGDELNADIEINVQPPGKKLQNINLMSGGEKVLSAIALLFSILKMKPTPFCILDEIEAALDDANVYRYSEFLKLFSSNIQFIVITHRKGTMEASDVMYGVTMEEKGISKIVSVDLNK